MAEERTATTPGLSLDEVRALFPHTGRGLLYCNHAGTAPMSTRVVEAMHDYLLDRSEGRIETYPHDLPVVTSCKSMLAAIVNAESADRIALIPNTSDGLNIIAAGIPWNRGDRILLARMEFPANVWPYLNLKRLGVEIDFLEAGGGILTPEMIETALTKRTRLVALSAVQFLSGFRADMKSIGTVCRNRGVLFIVDAIQAVGAVRVDVQAMHIDALAAGGQKWQLSPHGTGFLYVTEELQANMRQSSLGWLGVADPWRFSDFEQPLAATARRYEGGSLNFPGLHGYKASLTVLTEFGTGNLETRILSLTDRLIDGFSRIRSLRISTPPERDRRAGIVTVTLPSHVDSESLNRKLLEHGLHAAVRQGHLRFSPHFYMTDEEMDSVVRIVETALKAG